MPVKKRQDHRINANRFAGTGGTRNQKMREFGEINHHRRTGNIFAKCHWQA